MFPNTIAAPLAAIVTFIAVGAGALLVLGLWTTLGSFVLAVLLVLRLIIINVSVPSVAMFSYQDFVLLAMAVSLLFLGSGWLSIDSRLREAEREQR